MLRTVLGALCLFAVVGFVAAEEKADAKKTYGKFKSLKDGTLTISVGKKGEEPKDVTFKVADDTKVAVWDGADKKEAVAKDAFKDLKPDSIVSVEKDGDKIVSITVGYKKK